MGEPTSRIDPNIDFPGDGDDDGREIAVCPNPNCGAANIRKRVAGDMDGTTAKDDHAYYCDTCMRGFDEPTTKRTVHTQDANIGAARALEQADPDDWP